MDNEITKFPKEYITDVPTPKIPSVNMIRDSRNRLVLELPSKDRIMVSIDPGSKITSTATETATGATDNYRGEDIKVNSISIDNILDGDNYQRVKSVAINSDGMVVLDQTIEGDYSLVLSTDIQAGSILLSKTIQSNLYRTVSDTEKATWDAAEAGITKSDTAPENPDANDLWIDTSDTPSVLKRWTGSEWVLCSVGNIDDLADGTTYQRVKSASLTAGGLILLDQVSIGDTYGLLNKTDISAGHVILDTVEQAEDGTYALVLRTAIDAGKIVLTGSAGVSGSLPVGNTDAKCTDPNADQTSANPQNTTWLTSSGAKAMAFEDVVGLAKLDTTIISGGYVKTSLLTADNIVTGTLQTILFRSAASGIRTEIQRQGDSYPSAIVFYGTTDSYWARLQMYSNTFTLFSSGKVTIAADMQCGDFNLGTNNEANFNYSSNYLRIPVGTNRYK